MKKVNYILDLNNVIVSWTEIPLDETAPYVEVDDSVRIHAGFDRVIDGKFVPDVEGYAAFLEKQQNKAVKMGSIARLKTQLAATDYQAIKHSEGLLSEQEYAPIKAQRQAWRDEINQLEEELASM